MEVGGDDAVGPEEVVRGLALDGHSVEVLAGLAGDAVVADDVVVETLDLPLRNAQGQVLA